MNGVLRPANHQCYHTHNNYYEYDKDQMIISMVTMVTMVLMMTLTMTIVIRRKEALISSATSVYKQDFNYRH